MSNLSRPEFNDEINAREWLEAELWPNGPVCPHCGIVGEATLMHGKSHRPGLYQCNACHEPFTVTVGTLYERSHIPLHKWLAVTHLMMASKKGMSAAQISRMLGFPYKTAWFMCHRIRESLRETTPKSLAGKTKLSKLMKPTLAAKPKTARGAFRLKRPCSHLLNAMAKCVRATLLMLAPRRSARPSALKLIAPPI